MTQSQKIVEAKGIRRTYDMGSSTVEALRGVDIEIEEGDFVGIMGQSGSGKSTLMHILGCLDRPTEGTYVLAGRDVSRLSDQQLSHIRATQIGFVFQTFNLIPQCSVFENVALPFLYQKTADPHEQLRIEKAIEQVGLSSRRNHRPSELSGGEMQRVAIARAMLIRPLLILADEPTGNLDSRTGHSILALFRELNEQRITVVVVTHDSSVARHCRDIVCLHDGMIVGSGVDR